MNGLTEQNPDIVADHRTTMKSVKISPEVNGQKYFSLVGNGGLSPRPISALASKELTPEATLEMLEGLFRSELSNLLSTDPIIPPSSSGEVKSWTLASHLIHSLDAAHSSGGEQAKVIADRSCAALEKALQPLLEPGEGLSLSSEDLPSPQSIRAMAALAAQAALWAADDGAVSAAVMETLLQCAEQCTSLGAELQPEKPAGQYSLQLALATARNLKALMGRFPCGSHIIVEDAAARMHVLCMASARLTEQEWSVSAAAAPIPGSGSDSKGDCARKVAELWMWDLDRPVDENGALSEASPARSLTRVWTEAAAVLLGAAWCTQPSEVRSAFIPLATASSEKEGVLLLLGRLLAIVGGEESASRLLIPVVMDTLAAKSGELDAGVYGVAAHVLASMASTCAASDNSWGYTQVVDLLIKLYKFPQFSISAALLHGTASSVIDRQGYLPTDGGVAGAAVVGAAGSPIAPGQDILIYGRCPGALAAALTRLSIGVKKATLKYRKDLRKRVLALFSDFSLIMPNETFVEDLGALLPAAAAAVQGLQDYKHESKKSSMALSSSNLSLDTLSSMQEEGRAFNAALRHVWLHSSVYDFASFNATTRGAPAAARAAWPSEWAEALSLIAASTPALLFGSEQQKEEAFLEDAVAEYGSWLNKLGHKAEGSKLMAQIIAVLGTPPPGAVSLPPPLAAHVLTIAYKAVCEATFQHTGHPAGFSSLEPVLTHMQYSLVTNIEYPWLKQTLVAAFSAQVKRLAILSTAGGADAEYAARAVETTAEVLTANLKEQGPNEDVARTAYTLLESLTNNFPSLLFSNSVFAAALHAVAEQAGLADTLKAQYEHQWKSVPFSLEDSSATSETSSSSLSSSSLPRARMIKLVRQAAAIAPGPAEALVLEMIRHLGAKGGRHASIAMQFTAEVMQALHAGRSHCSLPDLTGSFKGLVAWSVKLHALGTIDGLTAAEQDGAEMIGGGVVARCARSLLTAIQENAPGNILISKIIDGAAAIVRDELDSAVPPLLRLLAWVPLSQFVPEVTAASCMVWHWLLAVGNPALKQTLLEEIAAAWIASKEQRVGLFDVDVTTNNTAENDVEQQPQEQQQQQQENNKNFSRKDTASQLAGIRAHHAWAVFFSEVWRSQHYGSAGSSLSLHATLGHMIDASLGGIDDSSMSQHPSALGARFRFLQLALSFLCAGERDSTAKTNDTTSSTTKASSYNRVDLYKKIISSALAAFNDIKVRWYEGERSSLREATNSILDFSVLLRQAPSLFLGATARNDPLAPRIRREMEGSATELLKFLLPIEAERLSFWADPVPDRNGTAKGANNDKKNTRRAVVPPPVSSSRSLGRGGNGYTASNSDWSTFIKSAWEVSPRLALALGSRFFGIPAVTDQLQQLVNLHAENPAVQKLPQAVQYLATPSATASNAPSLQYLKSWAPVNLQQAMSIISSRAGRHPTVMDYVMRSLDICDPEEVSFFLPQLVQLLRNDPEGSLENFLLQTANESVYFAYLLVCQLSSEGTPPEEAFNPAVKRSNWSPPVDTGLWAIADRVKQRLWGTLHGPVRDQLDSQLKFFSDVTDISGKLYPVPKEERKSAAVKFVRELTVPRNDLFMPTDLHAKVLHPIPESAAPMQSAAKCPILVAFKVEIEQGDGTGEFPIPAVEAAIFKVGDDCRQDVLALQVIELLKNEFDAAALPLPLVPYGVIPTGHECGIIEVVPHAKSRAQLGELTDGGLFEVFQHEFGLPGSPRFEAARSAFIASSAGYAVASYLLQAKDRHNGNIMIDNHGRIIHIDFGYILGISPGGNMGFESAAFKLSFEMTELLDPGSTRRSPHFLKFQELCIKGYLAARSSADAIVATVAMSEASKLPCFGRGATLDSLRQRFHLEMSDAQAAEFMRGLINDAYDKWTTGVYDLIQYYQNKIAF